jgi:hypothetical protein
MRINNRPGICIACKETVKPEDGYVQRDENKECWRTIHKECYEALAAKYLREQKAERERK